MIQDMDMDNNIKFKFTLFETNNFITFTFKMLKYYYYYKLFGLDKLSCKLYKY